MNTRRNLALLLLLTFGFFAAAQNTADVRGRVVDVSKAPVVSAFVILSNQETDLMRAATTDENGVFQIPSVPVGTYSLQVNGDGFPTYQLPGVRVSIGQVSTIDVVLGGSAPEKARQKSTASLVESNNTQLGVVTDATLIENLPLKSRDTFDLLQLQPGVEGTLGADLFFGNDRPGVVSVNGGRARSNRYSVNGGPSGDLMVNTPTMQPSPDSIREFRVITHNYDAELGTNSASVLNVVTKSGTRELHGSLFEYFRNKVLNARGYFDVQRPDFNQNDFGGTLGGPLHRNTFFFLSYERRGLRRGISSAAIAVPNSLERGGDFSQADPFTGILQDQKVADVLNSRAGCAAAVAARGGSSIMAGSSYASIFPGNVIPSQCFDPTAAALLAKYVPAANAGDSGFSGAPLQHARNDQATVRLDHTFAGTQQLSFYYYGSDEYDNEPFSRLQGQGANVPGFSTDTRARYQQANLAHVWNINAKTNNELRLVYYRGAQGNLLSPQNTMAVQDSCIGVPAAQCFSDPSNPRLGITPGLGPSREGLPFIQLDGGFAIGNSPNGSFSQTGNVYEATESFAKILGNHNLKFGTSLSNQRLGQLYFYDINGAFEFTGGGPNDVGSSTLLPNYLLGLPDTYSQGSANRLDVRTTRLSLFSQDSWRLRSNLTFNYGLRWDWNTPQADAGNRVQAFRPGQATTAFKCGLDSSNPLVSLYGSADCSPTGPAAAVFPVGLVFPGDKGVSNSLTTNYFGSFAPRLGLAYSPSASEGWIARLTGGPGNTSIRAGWGMFYDSIEELAFSSFAGEPPFGGSAYLSNTFLNTPFLAQNGAVVPNPYGGYLDPKRGSVVDFSNFRPLILFGNFPQKMPSQYTEQYHFTVQRQLPGEMLLQLGYVGSQGHRLLATVDENIGNPQTCLDLDQIPGMSCGPFGADMAYTIPAGAIPAGVTVHLPYGSVKTVTGPNPSPIRLVGLRQYSSPMCEPTTGAGCPLDGVPVFGSIFTTQPTANASYNSLQALLSKRFTHGLQFVAAYTFSKSIDNASSYEETLNPIDPSRSRSLSLFDARHRFVVSSYWQLPQGHFQGLTGHLLNGWATSSIVTIQSGFPIRITSQSDRELMNSFDYETPGAPDLVAPFRVLDPRKSGGYYFDPASFADAALGTIGSSPRTICCGPGIANVDFAVHKSFQSGERTKVQLNAEFFNLFNHTQFLNPESNISSGPSFGQVEKARDPRIVQFALRFTY